MRNACVGQKQKLHVEQNQTSVALHPGREHAHAIVNSNSVALFYMQQAVMQEMQKSAQKATPTPKLILSHQPSMQANNVMMFSIRTRVLVQPENHHDHGTHQPKGNLTEY